MGLLTNLLSSHPDAQPSHISPECRDTLDPTRGALRTFSPEVLTYTAEQGKRPSPHTTSVEGLVALYRAAVHASYRGQDALKSSGFTLLRQVSIIPWR